MCCNEDGNEIFPLIEGAFCCSHVALEPCESERVTALELIQRKCYQTTNCSTSGDKPFSGHKRDAFNLN